MLFEGVVIKPLSFLLGDLGDPLLADAFRLFALSSASRNLVSRVSKALIW
jgi:hypothetical protein